MKTCSIDGCAETSKARGLCPRHYMNWYRRGDPLIDPTPRTGTKRPVPIQTRFWSKVDLTDPDGCWLWNGARRHDYGEVWRDGKRIYAHRAAFELVHGPLEPGQVVRHHCDTPLCVRPDHLASGTQADNIADMNARGRARGQFGTTRAVLRT